MLRQVDDFALASPREDIAKEIFEIIGDKIKFPSEKRPPFEYLGLLNDYNGVKVEQTLTNLAITEKMFRSLFSCSNFLIQTRKYIG